MLTYRIERHGGYWRWIGRDESGKDVAFGPLWSTETLAEKDAKEEIKRYGAEPLKPA